ncbi:hypothetical protein BDY21DRAFT_99141 [Lineolata rhizophorae]|uniref:Uncharacterized protein n=1 Tax=Lineolata rhizophorae TaxID=578093 RepID=A0A6A6NS69_9PEZI|nr:hypothetical protein BDY21DRAFT_99141 [Lineolata rhizophorae]
MPRFRIWTSTREQCGWELIVGKCHPPLAVDSKTYNLVAKVPVGILLWALRGNLSLNAQLQRMPRVLGEKENSVVHGWMCLERTTAHTLFTLSSNTYIKRSNVSNQHVATQLPFFHQLNPNLNEMESKVTAIWRLSCIPHHYSENLDVASQLT